MELYIRNQSKEMLTKVDYVYLEPNNKLEILGGNHYMINQSLGKYKSKERCLEILDDIQNILMQIPNIAPEVEEITFPEDKVKHYSVSAFQSKIETLDTCVYIMPKE
jgi:hypothetical protein